MIYTADDYLFYYFIGCIIGFILVILFIWLGYKSNQIKEKMGKNN